LAGDATKPDGFGKALDLLRFGDSLM